MRKLFSFFVFLLPALLLAQDSASVMLKAREHLNALAGPEMYGRGYVKNGDGLAAEYLSEEFKKVGAQPILEGFFQEFEFPVNTFPYPLWVQLDEKELSAGTDYLLAANSGSAMGSFAIEVVNLDPLEDAVNAILKAPCVECAYWFDPPETKDRDTAMFYRAAKELLAAVAPVIAPQTDKLTWAVASEAKKFPILELLYNGDSIPKTIHLKVRNNLKQKHKTSNVMAMIPAAKKSKEYMVFTAHYDHLGMMGTDAMFTGANDNASGTSMLLSLAEYYANNPPDINVVFIAFAGEEAGLLGSNFFVQHPTFDLSKIKFLLNLDIFGTGDDGITVVNATEHLEAFELLKSIGEKDGRLAKVKKRGPTQNSDHYWFTTKGVPAFFIYTMGGITAYHDILDRPETLPLTEFWDIRNTLIEFVEEY